jgi:hypothetical protein
MAVANCRTAISQFGAQQLTGVLIADTERAQHSTPLLLIVGYYARALLEREVQKFQRSAG